MPRFRLSEIARLGVTTFVALLALVGAPATAHADPISLGGDLELAEPLVFTTPDSGIDCNGHTVRAFGISGALQIASHSVTIRNCVIRSALDGVVITSRAVGPGIVIENNDISVVTFAVRVSGATGDAQSDILISNNVLATTHDESTIDITDARFVTASGNIVEANPAGVGITALRSRDISIIANEVEPGPVIGIWVFQGQDAEVSRNRVTETNTGIYVQDTNGMTVSRNAVADTRAHGIRLGGVTVRGTITATNNSVARCRVGLTADTTGEVLFASNHVEDNEDTGISLGVHVGYNGQPIVIRDNVLVNQPEIRVGGSARVPINLTMTNNQHIDN